MDAEKDNVTALGNLGTTDHSAYPRRGTGFCGEVYMPALSAWNRYLASQGTKMAHV